MVGSPKEVSTRSLTSLADTNDAYITARIVPHTLNFTLSDADGNACQPISYLYLSHSTLFIPVRAMAAGPMFALCENADNCDGVSLYWSLFKDELRRAGCLFVSSTGMLYELRAKTQVRFDYLSPDRAQLYFSDTRFVELVVKIDDRDRSDAVIVAWLSASWVWIVSAVASLCFLVCCVSLLVVASCWWARRRKHNKDDIEDDDTMKVSHFGMDPSKISILTSPVSPSPRGKLSVDTNDHERDTETYEMSEFGTPDTP
jgi:hypothetical protein